MMRLLSLTIVLSLLFSSCAYDCVDTPKQKTNNTTNEENISDKSEKAKDPVDNSNAVVENKKVNDEQKQITENGTIAIEEKNNISEKNKPENNMDALETKAYPDYSEPKSDSYSVQGKIIVIDAGHGIASSNRQEAIAPNSDKTKNAFVSGTSGKNQTEEQLNLIIALKLDALLTRRGAVCHLTRNGHNCDMSNIDRAEFGNNLNADISVKIHADGNNSPSAHGTSVLVPGNTYVKDQDMLSKSRRAGELILEEMIKQTGFSNRGISVRHDMTGFNWSKIPVVLVELGFMTNPSEDQLMETENCQNKMVLGIAEGLERYFK